MCKIKLYIGENPDCVDLYNIVGIVLSLEITSSIGENSPKSRNDVFLSTCWGQCQLPKNNSYYR